MTRGQAFLAATGAKRECSATSTTAAMAQERSVASNKVHIVTSTMSSAASSFSCHQRYQRICTGH